MNLAIFSTSTVSTYPRIRSVLAVKKYFWTRIEKPLTYFLKIIQRSPFETPHNTLLRFLSHTFELHNTAAPKRVLGSAPVHEALFFCTSICLCLFVPAEKRNFYA
ncbi:MAG: hypothetical protein QXS66_04345 [Thermoproteota archaeon]